MPFPALKEAEERLAAKQKEMHSIFDEAGPELDFKKVTTKSLPAGVPAGDTRAIAALVRKLNDECAPIMEEIENLRVAESAATKDRQGQQGHGASGDDRGGSQHGGDGADVKSIGQSFVESMALKGKAGPHGPEAHLDVDLKTVMSTIGSGGTEGWVPRPPRNGVVVDFATRPIQVTDLIPSTPTDQNAVFYMEETTFTNNAAEVAESTQATPGTYPEAALVLTERSSLVRKIAVFLPVTDEQLADIPQAQAYIDNRLPFMLRQRLDSQILVGNGTAPNLRGLLNVVGIQTQAKGTDPTPDAIFKAIVKVQTVAFSEPSGIVFNPTDWQNVRLLRTADGIYIWGQPSDAGPARIWGYTVTQAVAMTLGTAAVVDFTQTSLAIKRGVDVQVSNSHGTMFVEGKQAIRADMRVALVVYRPAAVCTVTGL